MKDIDTRAYLPTRHLVIYPADGFRVTHGVNEGDAITDAAELVHDDVYELAKGAAPTRLAVAMEKADALTIASDTGIGRPGAPLFIDSVVTFMAPTRTMLEALLLVEVEPEGGTISNVYLHPLGQIETGVKYSLVTIDRDGGAKRLAESASVAFTRGTHITMGDGRQVPVENLTPGDRVLTRDSGVQEVRWVGIQTMRAEGAFAPIVIEAGALNNINALTVSPNHRLFIYQRVDAMMTGQRELLVKAGLLVNGKTVTQRPGGFVDYVQVLFDKHEIIYAEGIAAESHFVDHTTRPGLPAEIAAKLRPERPSDYPLGALELREGDLKRRPDLVEMLKRVSAT
ncbi:Hint domain-containing protein [Maritimibacter dapengensis]|uniref:Hint domain-containing protein n=1 Tax=Maritimibacter dapengensis TaxID=2836868 RepID=A0ABS6T1M1_9RHOB|nr:Hint domain-containing protein [Maritimibacter dapengensis]MBV7379138.1 Hint domain-containing protein [Maritimibacter dapengensis]